MEVAVHLITMVLIAARFDSAAHSNRKKKQTRLFISRILPAGFQSDSIVSAGKAVCSTYRFSST